MFRQPPSPDKSSCLFLSFVQVALSRVMLLKCQLSVWTCIALDIKYSSPHTNSQCYTERNKIWSLHFPFPWRPCALIICQSDRCFSNDGVSCVLNFYQSPTVSDCGTLYTIWWQKPPWTESLCLQAFCREVLTAEKDVAGVVHWGEPSSSLRLWTWTRIANMQQHKSLNPELDLLIRIEFAECFEFCFGGCDKYYLQHRHKY